MLGQISISERLVKSQYLKSVATLASGTALAQAIPLAISPVLTRLYTPENFGMLAVFTAIVSSLSPAVCGKYEVAMVLPQSNSQGIELLGIALWFAFIMSSVFLLVVTFFSGSILSLLKAQNLSGWIYLTPIFLFLTGLMTAMTYFANRQQDYGMMARSKIVRAFSAALISIVLGMAGFGVSGLIFGVIVGLLFAVGYLFYLFGRQFTPGFLTWNSSKKTLLKNYKDFPLYNASSGLLDGITMSLPVFFLAHYFPETVVGFFALVLRIGNTPLSFISGSVSQVNLKKIVDLVNNKQDIRSYLFKLTGGLFLLVLPPTILFVIFSPALFANLFGAQWREAGHYMQILIPAMSVKFIVSTLSSTLGATKNNHLGMIWKLTSFFASLAVFSWVAPKGDEILFFKAAVVMDIVLYLFYYCLIWKAANQPRNIIE
jgi:O-antigen/teichoic acid export membrane protein